MSIRKNGQIIAGYAEDKTYHYNVGDIFYTSRLDTSLNGAVECNGGEYSTEDYTGDGSIGNLLENGKLPYVSITEFNNIVSSKGSCRAFGWDGTGTTTFKVPKLADVYIEAGTASTAGEFIDESLPNITGQGVTGIGSTTASGTTWNKSIGSEVYGNKSNGTGGSTYYSFRIHLDASRSSSIYQDNAHVHPNSVRYRAMIQLFNSATDEAVAICGDVVAELANKEDVDTWVYYQNGSSGYRYNKRNGYCEQWGFVGDAATSGYTTYNFLKIFKDANYCLLVTNNASVYSYTGTYYACVGQCTVSSFGIRSASNGSSYSWKALGYLAEGQY